MLLPKVVSQERIRGIVVLFPVTLAEVAPEVDLAQVGVEHVVVKEAFVAKLAERVSLVAGIVRVTLPAVSGELLSGVLTQFAGKEF